MAGVCRQGDVCTGHGCYPSRVNSNWSGDVFVNGRGIHRVGDTWVTHCCAGDCHSGVSVQGSSTVFANGQNVMRIGDSIDCGSKVATGSGDVFCG